MSSYEGNKDDNYKKELEDWSSDGEYLGSEDNYWRSDVDWNGGSSMAGEASGVSEATEEEQPEEEEEEERKKNPKQKKTDGKEAKPKKKFNMDDVGTDDDSRPLDDTTERSDKYFKSNVSEMTDISDIEDQISEAQSKFAEDKQSLSSVIGLVDEVTIKGESLARKASETSTALDKEKFNKGALMENKLKLLESNDDISYDVDVLEVYESSQKGRKSSVEKYTSGRIEYIESDNEDSDSNRELKQDVNLNKGINYEYADSKSIMSRKPGSTGSGSAGSGSADSSGVKDSDSSQNLKCGGDYVDDAICLEKNTVEKREDAGSTSCGEGFRSSEDGSCSRNHLKIERSDDEDTVLSAEPSIMKLDNESASGLSQTCEECSKDECLGDSMTQDEEKDRSENSLKDDESDRSSRASPEFDEPECCKNERHKHMCCFINIGGGGDDGGRETEIINRLKKLKDDITNMREELSHARKECKKESEEVAKLIEETIARNKAAEQQEENAIVQSSTLATPPKTPPAPAFASYILEEIRPQQGTYQQPVVARAQVPIPTAVLEDRLRATRQTASTSYRESLQQLEMMVEKEMASIQDSMTRLEPLNKMAAEWDHLQHVRSRSMTFMRDYRMEMVTAEMRLQGEKNLQKQSIEIN